MRYFFMRFFRNWNHRERSLRGSRTNRRLEKSAAVAGKYSILSQSDRIRSVITGVSPDATEIQFNESSDSDCSSDENVNENQSESIRPMINKRVYNMRQQFEENYEELVDSKNRLRKQRIYIGVGTGLVLAVLLAIGIYLVVDGEMNDGFEESSDKGVKLEDILAGKFIASRFNGSLSGQSILFENEEGDLYEYNPVENTKKVLLSHDIEHSVKSILHEKSPDNKYLLAAKYLAKRYRHSFFAHYFVIDLATGLPYNITIDGVATHAPLLFAKWGPVGNSLILNYNGNLYYKPEVHQTEIRLTFDTSFSVLNGHPDWVYEEEVFASNIAAWFNPSGTKLAYIRFDDTQTRTMNLSYYGVPGDLNFQYPLHSTVYYPKAGSANPFVDLYEIDLRSPTIEAKKVLVPPELNTIDHLITTVEWIDDNSLLAVYMNRIQNEAYIQVWKENSRHTIWSHKSSTGWIDIFTPPHRNKDGSKVALILPHDQGSNLGSYRHLTLLDTAKNSGSPIALTSGQYVVQEILHWDHDNNTIYYSANTPESSRALHIYGIKAEKGQKPQCLTCDIKVGGVSQSYFSAEIGSNGKFAVITSQGPDVPQTGIYSILMENNNLQIKLINAWESNNDIRNTLRDVRLPKTSFHSIDLGNGFTSQVMLLLPPGADLSGKTKYPMLVDVYGGPDSYSVVDRWSLDWGSYLASNHSVIYAKIDGRGSGLRGEKLLHSVYLKLGSVEIDDQIQTAKKLQETLPYIDSSRMGIWGWSYGGYAAAMALAKDDAGVFKCATSVAPVTDWAYYDSIYTERFMDLPLKNQNGYENGRLTKIATKLQNKQYMLVHGTLDDNVHYQQAMVLAKVLEQNDILFKQISYPDEDHGLNRVRPHLYHSLDKFFKECFVWK